jgi:hypothetical protein
MNLIGGRSEPSPGDIQSGRGDVEHRDVAKSAGEQGIDKDRRAAAHVDHLVIRRDLGDVYHPQQRSRLMLEPAARRVAVRVRDVPMLRRAHHRCHPLILP